MAIVTPAGVGDDLVALLPALRAFARTFCRDKTNADDLVQETLAKALSNMDQFEPGTRMKSWLFTIMRNTFYTSIKVYKRELPGLIDCIAASPATEASQEWCVRSREVQDAIARLPPITGKCWFSLGFWYKLRGDGRDLRLRHRDRQEPAEPRPAQRAGRSGRGFFRHVGGILRASPHTALRSGQPASPPGLRRELIISSNPGGHLSGYAGAKAQEAFRFSSPSRPLRAPSSEAAVPIANLPKDRNVQPPAVCRSDDDTPTLAIPFLRL